MKYTDDNLEWHDENELIRKLDAVEAVLNMADSLEEVVDILMTVPSVDAGANEWCKDCKEYDKENHKCPRFNRVIRTALEDADVVQVVRCKECKGLRKHELIINDTPYITSYWCERVYPNIQIPDDQVEKHFCSFGERREP